MLKLLAFKKCIHEGFILFFIERAVEVIRIAFVVAGFGEDLVQIEALGIHDGCDGIEEIEVLLADEFTEGSDEGVAGQWACCDEAIAGG